VAFDICCCRIQTILQTVRLKINFSLIVCTDYCGISRILYIQNGGPLNFFLTLPPPTATAAELSSVLFSIRCSFDLLARLIISSPFSIVLFTLITDNFNSFSISRRLILCCSQPFNFLTRCPQKESRFVQFPAFPQFLIVRQPGRSKDNLHRSRHSTSLAEAVGSFLGSQFCE